MPPADLFTRGRGAIARAIDQIHIPWDLGLRASEHLDEKHATLEEAFSNRAFRFMIRLARDLISAGTVGEAVARTLDVAFEALPVHRGCVLLRRRDGVVECEVARIRDHVEYRPKGPIPVSEAILDRVLTERVALYTTDALHDERLASTDSLWAHGIRAAMCVPLWSETEIIGFMQVDSPVQIGGFNEHDLDFLIALGNLAAIAVQRIRERETRLRLQRYHSPAVVEQVLRESMQPNEVRALTRADVTVLFGDIVGFTTFAEAASLEDVATILSGFCKRVADAVFSEGGTVDKFLGDGVMAFFGAPIPAADHALRGVRCGTRIQEAMTRWNRDRVALALPTLHVRVGINSGPVIVGDVGSAERADYTAIGNTVNVAARLEEDAAGPGDVVFSGMTRRLLPADFKCEDVGEVALRGLGHAVHAYRLRGSAIEGWQMAL